MKRSARLATAVMAVALSAGITAPAAHAAHVTDKSHHSTTHQSGIAKALRKIDHLDKRLVKADRETRTTKLDEADRLALSGNITSDREILTALAASVVDTESAKVAIADLKHMRPANYAMVINHLRFAQRLAVKIDDALAAAQPGSPDAVALVKAQSDLALAIAAAHEITSTSTDTQFKDIFVPLMDAKALLDGVTEGDDAPDGEDGPVLDKP